MTYVRDDNGNVIDYSGFVFEVLNQISYKLNFTYEVVEPADKKWGTEVGDGQWDGMVGQVVRGEVALAAAAMATTYDRMQVVDFTEAMDVHPYGFMYKRPSSVSKELLLTNPFEPVVWLGVAIAVAVIGPLYYVVHRSSYYYVYVEEDRRYGLFQLNRCVFYTFGAILQQGGDHLPDADSGRIFICSWWLFVITVVTYYSGALVALIIIPQQEFKVPDFHILVERGEMTWGFQDPSVFQQYLGEAVEAEADPIFKTLLEQGERHTPEDTAMDSKMWERIAGGYHVYIDFLSHLEQLGEKRYNETKTCDFAYSKHGLFHEHLALAFPKDSPWVDMFNVEIKNMLQGGMTKAWKIKYWPKENECNIEYEAKFAMIDIVIVSDMQVRKIFFLIFEKNNNNILFEQGAFYVLFGGIILSFFYLVGEWIYFKKNPDKGGYIKGFKGLAWMDF